MIPNLAPILVGMGVMGVIDIPLDPGTVMIGSIALGSVVDDTLHFLVRLRRALAAEAHMGPAIRATLHHSGRPIIVTSVVLSAGFSVLALGKHSAADRRCAIGHESEQAVVAHRQVTSPSRATKRKATSTSEGQASRIVVPSPQPARTDAKSKKDVCRRTRTRSD